jgi:hypothetical protein
MIFMARIFSLVILTGSYLSTFQALPWAGRAASLGSLTRHLTVFTWMRLGPPHPCPVHGFLDRAVHLPDVRTVHVIARHAVAHGSDGIRLRGGGFTEAE